MFSSLLTVFVTLFVVNGCVAMNQEGAPESYSSVLLRSLRDTSAMGLRSEGSERRVYPACQDGSGGMCVPQGECPEELKSTHNSTTVACPAGKECCFGPPKSDKSCGSRGGQCMAANLCGVNAPRFLEATDCDRAKGEICCILTI